MVDEDSGEKPGFRVQDRRRFDSSGHERSDPEERRDKPQPEGETSPADEGFVMKESAEPDTGEGPEINFSSFVLSLATQALMQLGQIAPPEGVQVPVDRRAARQTIDIIAMLEEKTKGNLSEDEAQLVEEILHNLRLGFVKAA